MKIMYKHSETGFQWFLHCTRVQWVSYNQSKVKERQIEGKKSSPHLDGGVALYPFERGRLVHLRMRNADPRQRRRLWRRR